jgi:hypothetical protein
VIDVERQLGIVLAQRIVGQFRHVHDCMNALQIARLDLAYVTVDRSRKSRNQSAIAEQPAVAVIPGIESDDVVPTGLQHRREKAADVALDSSHEQLHLRLTPCDLLSKSTS